MAQPGYTNTEKSGDSEGRSGEASHQYTMMVRITAATIRTAIIRKSSRSLIRSTSTGPTLPTRRSSAGIRGRGTCRAGR